MRRNSTDIEANILRITIVGAWKTRIVYEANLNFCMIEKYLPRLIKQGFIEHDGGGVRSLYHTTPRGHEFLRRYDALHSLSEQPPLLEI